MGLLIFLMVGVLLAGFGVAMFMRKRNIHLWLASYLRQDWRARPPPGKTRHLMFCFVDHYEPMWARPTYATECARVQRWRDEYPKLCAPFKDADGRSPIHSFFYPEEEYRPEHLEKLVELCRMGLGEIEIHLHHEDDTEAGLREKLKRFTQMLVDRHDALPVDPVTKQPLWSFIHGNWALDNSHPEGLGCGVDHELVILREEGCYADYTLPAAPDPCQTRTINQIYYAKDQPHGRKSHDSGTRVQVGGTPEGDLMILQGPLGFMKHSRKWGLLPRIENGDVRVNQKPTPERIDDWVSTGIHVEGRPEWIFVKIYTHGTQEHDMDTLLGEPMRKAYEHLHQHYNDGTDWKLHYVSAREMYNIVKAAEAGLDGEPGQYRDHVIARPGYQPQTAHAQEAHRA
ncbi:hypothetical protein [Leptothrix ochracea]|uniref:hypothetical protein n=1 Tax=Leptothrix ochracea TaxID=735331 RepID=UPI0034E1C4C3